MLIGVCCMRQSTVRHREGPDQQHHLAHSASSMNQHNSSLTQSLKAQLPRCQWLTQPVCWVWLNSLMPPSTVELHTSWHSFVLSSSQLHCRSIICSRYPAQGRLRVSSHCIGFCWWTSLGLSEPMTNPFPSYWAASNWRLAIWSKLQPWHSVVAG